MESSPEPTHSWSQVQLSPTDPQTLEPDPESWCVKLLSLGEFCYTALSLQSLIQSAMWDLKSIGLVGVYKCVCVQFLCILCPGKRYVVIHTHRKTRVCTGSNKTKEQAYHKMGCMWSLFPTPGQKVPPVPVLGNPRPRLSPLASGF